MILCPCCKRRASDLLLSLEDELHIMLQATFAHHELESLDMHEELSLIIICSTGIDCTVSDFRLKRIRVPELDRIYRLHVIMAVHQNCRKRRIDHLLSEHYRMAGCRKYRCLVCASLHKKLDKTLRATLHIWLVLLKRAHGRNSQKREQFLEEPFLIGFNVGFHMWLFCQLVFCVFECDVEDLLIGRRCLIHGICHDCLAD